jgi:hypothetical protein
MRLLITGINGFVGTNFTNNSCLRAKYNAFKAMGLSPPILPIAPVFDYRAGVKWG